MNTVEFPNLFSGDIWINRVAFSFFGIDVYWYGILIAIGVILGFSYALKRSKKLGLISDSVFDIAFISTIIGFLGARIYYCVFYNLNPDNENKYDIITTFTKIHDGGLAIYGGLIFAIIAALILCKIKKNPFLPLLDTAAPAFLIGQGIGRWGNFINQECYGTPTAGDLPWGMTGSIIANDPLVIAQQEIIGTDGYALVHPCFLYEFLWCAVGFVLIHFLVNRFRSFDGEVFLAYVLWYGAGRGWIEGLRTDSLYIGSLRVSQVVAIASAAFALVLWIYFKIKTKKDKNYLMYVDTDASRERLAAYSEKLRIEKELANGKKAMKSAEKEKSQPIAPSILGDSDEISIDSNSDESTSKNNEDKTED